jgi:hypothetical protein
VTKGLIIMPHEAPSPVLGPPKGVAIIVLMKGNKTAVKMNYGNGILI